MVAGNIIFSQSIVVKYMCMKVSVTGPDTENTQMFCGISGYLVS